VVAQVELLNQEQMESVEQKTQAAAVVVEMLTMCQTQVA